MKMTLISWLSVFLLTVAAYRVEGARCDVKTRSWAFGDTVTNLDKSSYVSLNGVKYFDSTSLRGLTLLVVDPVSCSASNVQSFDTYGSQQASTDLANYINALPVGSSIIGVTMDDAAYRLNSVAKDALKSLGVDASGLAFRGKLFFYATKGSTEAFVRITAPGGASLYVEFTIVRCYINGRSWGMDDSVTSADKSSYVSLNGIKYFDSTDGTHRGFTLLNVNVETCTASNVQSFDTFGSQQANTDLANYIKGQPDTSRIIGVTSDDAAYNLNAIGKDALKTSLGIDVSGLAFRGKLFFNAIKGTTGNVVNVQPPGGGSLYYELKLEMRF